MKLTSFPIATSDGEQIRIGAVKGDKIVDLTTAYRLTLLSKGLYSNAALRISKSMIPNDMKGFIENDQFGLEAANEALDYVFQNGHETGPNGEKIVYALEDTKLLPPITNPPMLRDFMAFETHLKNIYPKLGREIPDEWYEIPAYYKANPSSISGHLDEIVMPSYASQMDIEFELAVVIGKGGKNIPKENALDHIYGVTIYNDFSAREIQSKEIAIGLGPSKAKDFTKGHTIGPWIVTMDEVKDLYDLPMKATVNGEVWTDDNSGSIHWKFEDLIAHASMEEFVQPGEVLGSGTIGWGSGHEHGKYLYPGDKVTLEVKGIGTLTNTVVAGK